MKSMMYITALVGVPFHELSHLIMGLLFGFKPVQINLISFNENQITGNVIFQYKKSSIVSKIGLTFVSLAPFITLLLVFRIMLNQFEFERVLIDGFFNNKDLYSKIFVIIENNFQDRISLALVLQIYLMISISIHSKLSLTDLSVLLKSLPILIVLILLLTELTYRFAYSYTFIIIEYLSEFILFLVFVNIILVIYVLAFSAIIILFNIIRRLL